MCSTAPVVARSSRRGTACWELVYELVRLLIENSSRIEDDDVDNCEEQILVPEEQSPFRLGPSKLGPYITRVVNWVLLSPV